MDESTNQPINQPMNQSIVQPTNLSTKQSKSTQPTFVSFSFANGMLILLFSPVFSPHFLHGSLIPVQPTPVRDDKVHPLQSALSLDFDATHLSHPLVQTEFKSVGGDFARKIA